MARKLDIIYEDDHLIAVNKAAGMLTIPDRFRAELPNVKHQLQRHCGEVFTVHRLDKFTSGVLLFAKDAESHSHLSQQWMDRSPEKYYTAIVDGVPGLESGQVDLPLAESMTRRGKMIVNPRGKESVTLFKITESYERYSLLYLKILTGRMHQIRVHMAEMGHPLIVDELYGRRTEFFLSEVKGRKYKLAKYEEERPLLTRQPLHASKLVVAHPASDEPITIDASLPKDMRAVINQLRKSV